MAKGILTTLDYELLHYLRRRPAYGYRLVAAGLGSRSSVYRSLAKLYKMDLLAMQRVKGAKAPDRKRYEVSRQGRLALHRRLRSGVGMDSIADAIDGIQESPGLYRQLFT